jgi:hypothetical protein
MKYFTFMKLILFSFLFIPLLFSCESNNSHKDFLIEYIENNYNLDQNNSSIIFVTEYDCIECVERISMYIENESKKNKSKKFYGEFLKLQKFGNNRIEKLLHTELQVEWRYIKNVDVFKYLSNISGNISGPFVVSFKNSEGGIKVVSI